MSDNSIETKNKMPDEVYEIILKYLANIKYGSITLTIQNGKIVQVEGSEKIRTV